MLFNHGVRLTRVACRAARAPAWRTGGIGWGGRIRTCESRDQNPMPYRLATPQKLVVANPPVRILPLCARIMANVLFATLRAACAVAPAFKIAPGDLVEPANHGIKTRCLTAWLRPKNSLSRTHRSASCRGLKTQPESAAIQRDPDQIWLTQPRQRAGSLSNAAPAAATSSRTTNTALPVPDIRGVPNSSSHSKT